ncbi:MAG: UDP-N-acetylmuramoyl-L-alanyl-D-glutamate--2,6-diaminopimelate ligase [Candidatus Omnitrophica bacterium]|nr:UDP-N-acetylmuramoyl-L-alanyl-D-glutamate--2,6-diaminopimelate ligase [Candidatus Omnitrophota bacterium]
MKLKKILPAEITCQLPHDLGAREISVVVCDSRLAETDCLFFAVEGSVKNGEQFIKDAVLRGAKTVVQNGIAGYRVEDGILYVHVSNPGQILRQAVDRFYGHPSGQVCCLGITGTNGKTTITYLLRSIFQEAGQPCGIMGTIQHVIGDDVIEAKNTTPGLVDIQKYVALMRDHRMKYCAMEVSSHGLAQGRVDLIDFRQALFTNLTQDHMDYHKTEEEYFLAKSKLFTHLHPKSFAVINMDDKMGERLGRMTQAKVMGYAIDHKAEVMAVDIQMDASGSKFNLAHSRGTFPLETRLIGKHNIYNILAAASAALNENIDPKFIQQGILKCDLVKGRLEKVECGTDYLIFIDYAHTDDALKNVLESVRRLPHGKIILVFGCGGDRDKIKRPKMAKIAGELADICVVTSDNPRSEEPRQIIDEVVKGFAKENFMIEVDRTEAIRKALGSAKKGDIVLLAGKGHETYQIFRDKTIDYDERLVVREILKNG